MEQLNSDSDLRGVTITAHDTEGNTIYTFSVPEKATDDEITRLVCGDSWLIAPITLFLVGLIKNIVIILLIEGIILVSLLFIGMRR